MPLIVLRCAAVLAGPLSIELRAGLDHLYGNSGGYPSYASAAAIILFAIVLTITCINLLVSRKHVHY